MWGGVGVHVLVKLSLYALVVVVVVVGGSVLMYFHTAVWACLFSHTQ